MQVVQTHSHKNGQTFITSHHQTELADIYSAVASVDAVVCLAKLSKEKTKPALLFHPVMLNLLIKKHLHTLGWTAAAKTKKGFREPRLPLGKNVFREMDGIKNNVGLEVQFGKYAFMGYDIFSKMVIFSKKGRIECGIEVVPMLELAKQMSTGIGSFNQIVLDMQLRGEADIDIPTLVVGIGLTAQEEKGCKAKRKRFAKNPEAMFVSGEVLKPRKGASPGPKGAAGLYLEIEEELRDEAEEEEQR